ncbi:MAG: M13 family metallopeptidase, partial [Bacteroidales bacterium]|nr:M13 family metallopeptidase [Bacteroidales bacterium]
MKKTLITIMSLTLLAACGSKKGELTSGVNLDNLDTTASPVDDFYQYACGGWMANHPLDAEHARFGTFDELYENNQKQMKELIDSLSTAKNANGSIADKIATFYNVGMDSATIEKQGAEPLKPFMQKIAGLKSRDELAMELPVLHRQGFNPFFALFCEADMSNAAMQIGWLYQTGLGMDDRDYYLKPENAKIREAYMTMLTTQLELSGYPQMVNMPADKLAKMVMETETKVAKAQIDKVVLRNPMETFHKTKLADAEKAYPAIKLGEYFKAMGVQIDTFNNGMPAYMKQVNALLSTENVDNLKAYYAWQVISGAAGYLSKAFVDANFAFYGTTLSGVTQQRPRWKRVQGAVNGAMGEAVGEMYVAKYFPKEAKERMLTLVDNLKEAFAQRIADANWMDKATKEKAHEKLGAIIVKVGYPDKWRDYSGLDIKKDSYFANIVRSNVFDMDYMLSKINKPTDKSEWGMTPQTVNAYYNPTTNEICFPAGILQPPFFDMNADDAANYGAIGVVIGHEMTHGFDDQGRQYDRNGNLNDWWQENDAKNFKSNAQVLVDWFNGIKVLDDPEMYGNGQYTLGENIADNGGIHISYK